MQKTLRYARGRTHGKCSVAYDADAKVAIFIELEGNPGLSVTNAIEEIVGMFRASLPNHGEGWRWFEAYEYRIAQHGFDPNLAEVTFDRNGDPKWTAARNADRGLLLEEMRELCGVT